MKNLFLSALCLASAVAFSQQTATPATTVQTGLQQKMQLAQASPVKNLPFKSIGPTIMSGRVVDFAVNPNNPTEFYVGYASGGLWHTPRVRI